MGVREGSEREGRREDETRRDDEELESEVDEIWTV